MSDFDPTIPVAENVVRHLEDEVARLREWAEREAERYDDAKAERDRLLADREVAERQIGLLHDECDRLREERNQWKALANEIAERGTEALRAVREGTSDEGSVG